MATWDFSISAGPDKLIETVKSALTAVTPGNACHREHLCVRDGSAYQVNSFALNDFVARVRGGQGDMVQSEVLVSGNHIGTAARRIAPVASRQLPDGLALGRGASHRDAGVLAHGLRAHRAAHHHGACLPHGASDVVTEELPSSPVAPPLLCRRMNVRGVEGRARARHGAPWPGRHPLPTTALRASTTRSRALRRAG